MDEYRIRARRNFLTTQQLDEFNKICKTGKETIEWHSPNWVAMSRNQYEKLAKKAKRSEMKIYFDEYQDLPTHTKLPKSGEEKK